MEATMDTVNGTTLARHIRDALIDRILSGELAPGSRLKDKEIGAMFGTSSTPVREALRLLAQDGLVEILPYRGCVVRSVDAQELAEIFDVRIILEGHAARQAAARLTPALLKQLEAVVVEHEAAVAAHDGERAGAAGHRFHRLVAEAAGNRTLAFGLQHLYNRSHVAHQIYKREAPPADSPPYRTILEALRAGDGERAEALMVAHIAFRKARMAEALHIPMTGDTSAPHEP